MLDEEGQTMMQWSQLSIQVPSFAGTASHTRCFLHIVNLIAKSLLSQFDSKKMADNGDNKLRELAKECVEEEAAYLEQITSNLNDEEIDEESDEEINVDDNDEGLVDEAGELTDAQWIELERSLQPVKLALVKVCCMKRVRMHLQC